MEHLLFITLALLPILSSCRQQNPGVSREELVVELNEVATGKEAAQAARVAVVDTFEMGYTPPPGIKYQPKYMTGKAIRLPIAAALKNVRPLKLSELGSEMQFHLLDKKVPGGLYYLMPMNEGYLASGVSGLYLLNKEMNSLRMLFRNDVEVTENESMNHYFFERGIKSVYYEASTRLLRCWYSHFDKEKKAGYPAIVTIPLQQLLDAPKPLTPTDMSRGLPLTGRYFFGMDEGYAVSERFTNDFYTIGQRGDTLCHFTIGEAENYQPQRTYRTGEQNLAYYYKGVPTIRIAYSNILYRVKNASTLEEAYILDFGSLSRPTGTEVVNGANMDDAYFIDSWLETDQSIFIQVNHGYDCPNARRDNKVTLYSLCYNKVTKEFFSLPLSKKKPVEHPLPDADIPGSIPFWPNINTPDGQLILFTNGKSLNTSYPEKLKEIPALQGLEKDRKPIIITFKTTK